MTATLRFVTVLTLFGALTVASSALAQGSAVPVDREQIRLSFAPVVRQAAPAVVNIYAERVVRERAASPFADDPFFRRFFGDDFPFGGTRRRLENSLGSGVIVQADGVIVTNHHVIKDAESITVVLSDRREFEAKTLVTDERTDLAVLRIEVGSERLPALELGDSDALEVGDLVLAMGNPFGLGQTVSSGIVSGLARTSVGVTDFRSFIQTDAAINPGNSGGALVTMDGRLVGVNTAIYSRSGGSIGIGFAVPSNMVRTIVQSAVAGMPLVRPWLSLTGTEVTRDVAAALGLPRPGGVLVEQVHPQGPAARAGIRPGDVVVAIDRHQVDEVHALRFRLATRAIGNTVDLTVIRRGERINVPFELVAPPEDPPRDLTLLQGRHPFAGAQVVNLSPATATEFGFDDMAKGILIIDVARGSPAARIGLRVGDIVETVNGERVDRVVDLGRLTSMPYERWLLEIRRGERVLRLAIG